MRFRHVLGRPDLDQPAPTILYFLGTSPSIIVISFLALYFTAFQYLRYTNYRDPTSYFFDASRAYERKYSTQRIAEADKFITNSGNEVVKPLASTPTLCIGVATIARKSEQYVRRTVGSLLEGLTDAERREIFLNILIGHSEPTAHPIYNETFLKTLPNAVLEYRKADLDRIVGWERAGQYRNKTIFDYTYLLKSCYDTGAQYIAMVEDDVLAARGWFPEAVNAINQVELKMKGRPVDSKWIYLRLFYQESLFGWNSEFWATYLFWSVVVWIMTVAFLLWTRMRSRRVQSHLSNVSIATISCFCLPLGIALFFMAGRNSNFPLRNGVHEMNRFGCCSQGYIYPRSIVPSILEKADLDTDWLVDMMIEIISDKEGYVRWATVPSLLQHIGTSSSKGWGFDESARSIWNFGFELRNQG